MRLYTGENDREEDGQTHCHCRERSQSGELIQGARQADHETDDGSNCTEDNGALRGIRQCVQELGPNDAVKC